MATRADAAKRLGFDAHGRNVAMTVATTLDRYGQFRVAVVVDGKERLVGHFTAREDDDAS